MIVDRSNAMLPLWFIYVFSFICYQYCVAHIKFWRLLNFGDVRYSILFYPITLEGRRGTTDESATIHFHLVLFSAALVELAKSISVHSLILSSHLFFRLPLFIVLSLCPVGLSLLNQKTLKRGQTILVSVS